MGEEKPIDQGRRRFLVTSVSMGAGLTLGLYLSGCSRDQDETAGSGPGKTEPGAVSESEFSPNAFVRIHPDNTITVIAKHLEMGQGTYTGLATLVAEELDADWSQIQVEGAPANAQLYNNLLWGPVQGTGGSTAIANAYTQMREAGAAARAMLVQAAAEQWGVPAKEIRVRKGVVLHAASANQALFGELAVLAARQPVPEEVQLKSPEQFRLIGGDKLPRQDNRPKTTGTAIFTQDIKRPGMLTALVAHPPRFGARLKTFDASEAKKLNGVKHVVQIPNGVAVLATGFWSASQGREALKVQWDESEAFTLSSRDILAQYRALADKPGAVARNDGDVDSVLSEADEVISADYEFPYLAHAAMEPMNCVVELTDEGCEIWNGEQYQTPDKNAVAELLGLKADQVKLNMLYAGGSFGRRANPDSDYVLEAAAIAKAIDGKAPVKLVWTREDDMRAGYYRPMYFHRMRAALDDEGLPRAWDHRIVGQSIMQGTAFASAMIKDGVDATSVEGAQNMPYAVPNVRVDLHSPKLPVPVQWWRSVGSTHTAFAVETFIDELAARAGKDPVAYRRRLLQGHPRELSVLELAAAKGNWGAPLDGGRGRGVAVHKSFNSYVAQVVEVSLTGDDRFSVDRVVVAVDCGVAVNPDVIEAQMEGGMGFGLAAALSSEITFEDGRVEQSNFHDYTVLRLDQMPEVEVFIVDSSESPTGVGEPATPVIAPAVANALSAATGRRFYRLPLTLS